MAAFAQRIELGDWFEVRMSPSTARYFQFVAVDTTQLHSDVVRVIDGTYDSTANHDPGELEAEMVDFFSHVYIRAGLKEGLWHKCGHSPPPDRLDVLFRDTDDYGDPDVTVSKNWFVWKVSSRTKFVGKLRRRYQQAEIGVVVPPDSLVYRLRNGCYDFVYPDY